MSAARRRHTQAELAQLDTQSSKTDNTPIQHELDLGAVPADVRFHGLRAAHKAPHVGRRTDTGGFWSGRVPASHAWAFPYIAIADAGSVWATITFDCDDRAAMAAGLADLPLYNWVTWTPRGAHLTWCLATPVAKHKAARAAPERYLAHIAEYYHAALGADPSFGGLARNPTHYDQTTTWGATEPYTMDQLHSVLPFNWKKPRLAVSTIGRNHDLFMAVCRADRAIPALVVAHTMAQDVRDKYPDANHAFGDAEIAGIARSVERCRAKWDRQGHKPAWLAKQRARSARQTGKARKASASPAGSNEAMKPWVKLGISRRWWYEKKKRERECTVPNTVNGPSSGSLPF